MSNPTDALGVTIEVGDVVTVIHVGGSVRNADAGRRATVLGFTHAGNVRVDHRAYPDGIAARRAISPGCLAVARRDGERGHEGNRPEWCAAERAQTTDGFSTEPEQFVTVQRASRHFHGTPSAPVLHRVGCRYAVKAAASGNVYPEFDGPVSAAWVWHRGTGWDRACRVCCPEFA